MSPDTNSFSLPTPAPVWETAPEFNIVSPQQLAAVKWWEVTPPKTNQITAENSVAFGAFKKDEKKSNYGFLEMHTMTAATRGLVIAVVGLVFFFLAKVNTRWSENSPEYVTTVNTYKDAVLSLDGIIGYPGIVSYQDIRSISSVNDVNRVVDSVIPFMFKKDIMTRLVEQLKLTILTNNKKAQDITQEITKYGFIHPDMMLLMENSKNKIPIMTSLHTLETVKFGTALKLFSMLDTFLYQASQSLWIGKVALEQTIESYLENGEKYISNYLSMCYLNPYEKLPDCNQINDFANYFKYEQPEAKVDNRLLSRLLELVENKLETSSVASIKMSFNRFDPNAKNLAFEVTISTLAEDEVAFLAKGILNPHVFILSTLVNLLKQSLFVIGDSISVQNITVRDQNIAVGNIQIPIKTSSMSFDLPLQNSSEREIFDFLDEAKY